MAANVAFEDPPVPDASEAELKVFRAARKHLKPEVFDEERWKKTVTPAEWLKVVYLLNRGGRFEDYNRDKVFEGGKHAHAYNKLLSLYCEKVAGFKNAFTGINYFGYPCFIPVADSLGRPTTELEKSRTISNYWLLALAPENAILINPRDARPLGLKNGDRVKVLSATNPEGVLDIGPDRVKEMIGTIRLTEMIVPGCVSFSLGHGHWAMGSSDMVIDGQTIAGDPRRSHGVHANAAMWTDPYLKNTCLLDPIGGSASFYDTKVRLERA
jgi:anaerobic selenocysteine-containing dehydrogenase